MHLVNFKISCNLSQSLHFKSLFWDSRQSCNKANYILPTYSDTNYILPFRKVMKYWTKARLKPRGQIPKSVSVSDVRALLRSLIPFSFVDCNTLISLGLVPQFDSNSTWQVSWDFGISNILPGFTFTPSCSGLAGPACWDCPATCLASVVSLTTEEKRFYNPFLIGFLTKMKIMWLKLPAWSSPWLVFA